MATIKTITVRTSKGVFIGSVSSSRALQYCTLVKAVVQYKVVHYSMLAGCQGPCTVCSGRCLDSWASKVSRLNILRRRKEAHTRTASQVETTPHRWSKGLECSCSLSTTLPLSSSSSICSSLWWVTPSKIYRYGPTSRSTSRNSRCRYQRVHGWCQREHLADEGRFARRKILPSFLGLATTWWCMIGLSKWKRKCHLRIGVCLSCWWETAVYTMYMQKWRRWWFVVVYAILVIIVVIVVWLVFVIASFLSS